MKLNKRVKSSLVQTFLFNVIFLIALVAVIFIKLVPTFYEIEESKSNLAESFSELKLVQEK